MGSDTDYPVMSEAGSMLDKFGIAYEDAGCFSASHAGARA